MTDIKKINWESFKITVVMPAYNMGAYITQAIDSVLHQKGRYTILLVITDDASDDNTKEIMLKYEKEYTDRILVLFSKHNAGLLANELKVFLYMKSDYFCVLDPDDYWDDNYFIEKAVVFLEQNPDYVTYGSNTRMIKDNETKNELYIKINDTEKSFNGIEDFLSGEALPTHTSASVYRNSIFKNGIPDIMKDAVGTLSEASFRGDVDRYVMHLKYGKAKFVNECVSVYRIHEKGICQGSTMFHWMIMNARAELDYSRYYDDEYLVQFRNRAKIHLKKACTEIYKAAVFDDYFYISNYDKENFYILMNVACEDHMLGKRRKINMDFKIEDRKLKKLLANLENRTVFFWGVGHSSRYLLEEYYLINEKVDFFVDSDKRKTKQMYMERQVLLPKSIKEEKLKYVIIGNMYYQDILKTIKEDHLCEEDDIVNLYWYDRYIKNL